MDAETEFQALVAQAEQRERQARRRAVLLSVIPVLLAAALLAFTGWRVARAVADLQQVQRKLTASQTELASANAELSQVQAQAEGAQETLVTTEQQLAQAQQDLKDTRATLSATQAQLEQRQVEVQQLQAEVSRYQVQVDDLQAQVAELSDAVQSTTELQEFKFLGNLEMTLKETYNRYPDAAGLLGAIYDMQGTKWNPNGTTLEEGLDSPGFAASVLARFGFGQLRGDTSQAELRALLKARRAPQPGDVVFYPGGYTLFYFLDEQGRPFVIGMVPVVGVVALQPDFAAPDGYGMVFP